MRLLVKDVLIGDDDILIRDSIPVRGRTPEDTSFSRNDSDGRSVSESSLLRSGRKDPTLRGTSFCAKELFLAQDAGFQELFDQPHHFPVGYAHAYPFQKMVVTNVVKTTLDVAFKNPAIGQPAPTPIPVATLRQDQAPDMLQGPMGALSGPEPVRYKQESGLEDWL